MVIFLIRHPVVFIFLKFFSLLECPVMLTTLILVIRFWQQNLSNKDIDIINFVRPFQSFISHILTWCLNIMSDWKHFFCKAFQNPNFIKISCINSEKLDYQVSICSLIPPATAISKCSQDRQDTSVWWKLPFSIFFIIYYLQRAIINKVCKPELWFLCSAHPIIVLYICMKFHENISNDF